jgi:hypothetical protein
MDRNLQVIRLVSDNKLTKERCHMHAHLGSQASCNPEHEIQGCDRSIVCLSSRGNRPTRWLPRTYHFKPLSVRDSRKPFEDISAFCCSFSNPFPVFVLGGSYIIYVIKNETTTWLKCSCVSKIGHAMPTKFSSLTVLTLSPHSQVRYVTSFLHDSILIAWWNSRFLMLSRQISVN